MSDDTESLVTEKLTQYRRLRGRRKRLASGEAETTCREAIFPEGANATLRSGIRQVIPTMRHGARAGGISVVARRPADLIGTEGEDDLDLLMIPEARPVGDGRGFKRWADVVLSRIVFCGLDAENVELETEAWRRTQSAVRSKVFPDDSPP